jgi:hypothetical protein
VIVLVWYTVTYNTEFEIRTLETKVVFNRVDWRTNHTDPPATPADVYDELDWIQKYIDEHPSLGNLITALVSGVLIVQEYAFQGTQIFVRNAPEDILMIDTVSVQALRPNPFRFSAVAGLIGTGCVLIAVAAGIR